MILISISPDHKSDQLKKNRAFRSVNGCLSAWNLQCVLLHCASLQSYSDPDTCSCKSRDKCEMMSEVLHLEQFYMGTEGASWNAQCMKGQGDGIKCVPKTLLLIKKGLFQKRNCDLEIYLHRALVRLVSTLVHLLKNITKICKQLYQTYQTMLVLSFVSVSLKQHSIAPFPSPHEWALLIPISVCQR